MTIEAAEKLNAIFTENFLEENSTVTDLNSLYEKVCSVDASIERTEFEEYVAFLSKKLHEGEELSAEDLDEVAGGFGWATAVTIAAGIDAATKLVSWSYKAGKAVGEFIYNLTH